MAVVVEVDGAMSKGLCWNLRDVVRWMILRLETIAIVETGVKTARERRRTGGIAKGHRETEEATARWTIGVRAIAHATTDVETGVGETTTTGGSASDVIRIGTTTDVIATTMTEDLTAHTAAKTVDRTAIVTVRMDTTLTLCRTYPRMMKWTPK